MGKKKSSPPPRGFFCICVCFYLLQSLLSEEEALSFLLLAVTMIGMPSRFRLYVDPTNCGQLALRVRCRRRCDDRRVSGVEFDE